MNRAVWTFLRPFEEGLRDRWEGVAGTDDGPLTRSTLDRLRASHGVEVARFVSLQRELRARARGRLDVESLPFLTSKGLEQATAAPVARFRARRFASRGAQCVPWDACCGVGSDLVALEGAFPRLIASDRDAETLRSALASFALRRDRDERPGTPKIVAALADASTPPIERVGSSRVLGLFDPDRRPNGRRTLDPDRWSPPLDAILEVAGGLGGACVKLPPGIAANELEARDSGALELTWISLDGELKELALWTGRLAFDDAGARRSAVALRSSGVTTEFVGDAECARPDEVDADAAARAGWLVELDPAVWQAGLAPAFARENGLLRLAGGGPGGFLVGSKPVALGLARSWRIVGTTSGDRRRVRALLREHDVGPLVVKKRDHPETAEALARAFAASGTRRGTLAVTRVAGRTAAFLLEDADVVGDEGLEPPTPSV